MKYRLKAPDGTPVDATVDDTWRRVARALAAVEKPAERATHAAAFDDALAGFGFIPAGRTRAGARTDRTGTLYNCFAMGSSPTDLHGTYEPLVQHSPTITTGRGN